MIAYTFVEVTVSPRKAGGFVGGFQVRQHQCMLSTDTSMQCTHQPVRGWTGAWADVCGGISKDGLIWQPHNALQVGCQLLKRLVRNIMQLCQPLAHISDEVVSLPYAYPDIPPAPIR